MALARLPATKKEQLVDTRIFAERESHVRSYCRAFPDVFTRAKGAMISGESGRQYIDFFAGAGTLNYGHNNDALKEKLLDYLAEDNITHGLDMYTRAKRTFLETLWNTLLSPRQLDYKIMFCGPTGTNAVEAALKLARKITGRSGIFAFMGGYHGNSLGSLAATGNRDHRHAAGLALSHVTFMPFPYGYMQQFDTIAYMEAVLDDPNSGIEKPAAMIFETVQAEGGVVVAPLEWMQRLRDLCTRQGILLICDDIQAGCGRTGPFFSFERAGIVPDIVTLSKSVSGYGLPLALLLFKSEHDQWQPAEHTGTFRGNQLAFVGATAALEYFHTQHITEQVKEKEAYLARFLREQIATEEHDIRGIGLIWGIDFSRRKHASLFARQVAASCFEQGLIIERAGRNDTVLKLLPPLTIEMPLLQQGCDIIKKAIQACSTQ